MVDLSLFKRPAFVGAQVDGVRDLLVDVRDVPLPDALPAEHPRALAAQDRPRLPAAELVLVLRRAASPGGSRPACPIRVAARHRPRPERDRAVVDEPRQRRPRAGRCCCPASWSAASASASSTRRSPRPPSRRCGVERAGMASGINNTFRQVGIATGIAALGAIFAEPGRRRARSRSHAERRRARVVRLGGLHDHPARRPQVAGLRGGRLVRVGLPRILSSRDRRALRGAGGAAHPLAGLRREPGRRRARRPI